MITLGKVLSLTTPRGGIMRKFDIYGSLDR